MGISCRKRKFRFLIGAALVQPASLKLSALAMSLTVKAPTI
jgi:hypothetical protein